MENCEGRNKGEKKEENNKGEGEGRIKRTEQVWWHIPPVTRVKHQRGVCWGGRETASPSILVPPPGGLAPAAPCSPAVDFCLSSARDGFCGGAFVSRMISDGKVISFLEIL